jgi:chromosome segregation ATPase
VNEEFVDLRRSSLSSESFWPSFTDIMMVVVIIFLLTSMLLMVKNWELLDQLRNSMAAEQQAEKIIKDTSLENATLEEQLTFAQDEISMLRMQMMQINEHSNQLASELEDKDKQVVIVLSEKAQLQNAVTENEKRIAHISSQLSAMDNQMSDLKIDIQQKQKALDDEQQKILIITRERDTQSQKLTSLEEDYGSLKVKYDKLVKPARTAKGKHVAVVDYERVDGKARIRLKESEDGEYQLVTEKQLHQKLSRLKKKYPGKLYIRIIIPEKSGLTYSEAWTFMRGLLQKYDYYYQD